MKLCEIHSLIIQTDSLQREITNILDKEYLDVDGELRVKLGIAESNLFKICELLQERIKCL
jgi:hypothetical protein